MAHVGQWTSFHRDFRPGGVALRFGDEQLTWLELDSRVARLAAGLRAEGIGPGDRFGLLLRNHPSFVELVLAAARLGAAFVPLNTMLTPPELSHIISHSGLRLLVTDASFSERLSATTHSVEKVFFVGAVPDGGRGFDELLSHGEAGYDPDLDPDAPLAICYTSGTTGLPKGAVLTHRSIEAMASSSIAAGGLGPADRALLPLPLPFTGSVIAVVMPIMKAGGTLRITAKFDATEVLDAIEKDRITFLIGVPTVFDAMLRAPGFGERDLSSLREVRIGGANVPAALVEEYLRRGIRLMGAYGLTEGGGFCLQVPRDRVAEKIGSSGRPLLGQQVKVLRADGTETVPGQVGELAVKGENIMKEYLDDLAATAAAIVDGWLRTGDLAVADDDGFLTIVDRAKDMLISGGLNVYPSEIENVLRRYPGVLEVAVVGVPDEKWGEVPKAYVVTDGTAPDFARVREFLAGYLAKYKLPKHFEVVEELPRTLSGKVLKRELRRR
ncbi:long-chain fatty acid--CoA ligase [Amycolatopsis sp. K13G38]|uniref:Long-chain fatty acid--CoA ligase n=1 Tax=Amycolatopsis acididurans TaxID=2724524 RepID=A0ABX1JE36_9PSEU|nr:AMP-binding protein [Amycolatopsis acididurans]NKQ58048.1 long-chain fatty acid--CoA ligase [Amycolatopsis acididurans]